MTTVIESDVEAGNRNIKSGLLLFSDFEGFTGGNVENKYDNVSGISELKSRSGSVGSTSNSIIGSTSGLYDGSNALHTTGLSIYLKEVLGVSFWVENLPSSRVAVFGFGFDTRNRTFVAIDKANSIFEIDHKATNQYDFGREFNRNIPDRPIYVELYYVSINQIVAFVDGSLLGYFQPGRRIQKDKKYAFTFGGTGDSFSTQNFYGSCKIDNIMVETSDGPLEIRGDQEWLYNSGNGRTTSEIASRYGITLQ